MPYVKLARTHKRARTCAYTYREGEEGVCRGGMCIHKLQSCNKDVILFSLLQRSRAFSGVHYSAVSVVQYFISKNTRVTIFKVGPPHFHRDAQKQLQANSTLRTVCALLLLLLLLAKGTAVYNCTPAAPSLRPSRWRDADSLDERAGEELALPDSPGAPPALSGHPQGLALQMDQLPEGLPAALVRTQQRPAVLLQVTVSNG